MMKIVGDEADRLPYSGDLLQFKLISGTSQKDGDVFLTCQRSKIGDDRRGIITTDAGAIKITHDREDVVVSLLKCAVVVIEPFGLCRPVILTSLQSPKMEICFMVHMYSSDTSSFVRLNSFSLEKVINLHPEPCSIVDGPVILVQSWNVIHSARWEADSGQFQTDHYDLPLPLPHSIKAASSSGQGKMVLLGATEQPESSGGDIQDLFQSSSHPNAHPWKLLRVNPGGPVSVSDFKRLPCSYSTITRALLPLEESMELGNDRFEGGIILSTSLSQLVLIDSDGSIRVCQIPFSDSISLSAANVGEHGEIILIVSTSHGVCFIDLKSFSVGKHWPDHTAAFCDDFLHVGSDQILLLKDAAVAETGSFLLTDLTQTWPHPEDGEEVSNAKGDALQSMQNAVEALTQRLQISSNLLRSLEIQSQQKERVLCEGRDTLISALPTRGLHKRQPDLMCIIGTPKEPQSRTDERSERAADCSLGLTVQSLWRRVVRGKFVVGVLVTNTSTDKDRLFSNIHISLVCTSSSSGYQHSTTSHGTMTYPSDSPGGSSEGNRLEQGGKAWMTMAIDCPVFDAAELFMYDVVLMWRESTADGMSQERQRCVGPCSLSFSELDDLAVDLSTKKIKADEVTRVDYLAMDCVQLHVRLLVSCERTAMGGLPSVLCKDLGFTLVTTVGREGLLCVKRGHLHGVRVYKEPISPTSVNLDIHTWDQSQLVLFLRALHFVLPTDAVVSPRGRDEVHGDRSKSLAMKQMKQELEKLKKTLKVDANQLQQADAACGYSLDHRVETDRTMAQLAKLK